MRTRGRVDLPGATLLSAWLLALLLPLSEGRHWGWASVPTVSLLAAAAVLLAGWIVTEKRVAEPFVDLQMIRLRGVWTSCAVGALLGFGVIASFVLIPRLLQTPESTGYGFGTTVTEAGLYVFPLTAAMLVASPLVGRLATRLGPKLPLVLGAVIMTAGLVFITVLHDRLWLIPIETFVVGTGIGFSLSSVATTVIAAVPSDRTAIAAGLNTVARFIGNSFGSQLTAAILAGSVIAGGFPSEGGFMLAFGVTACAAALGTLFGLLGPPGKAGSVTGRR